MENGNTKQNRVPRSTIGTVGGVGGGGIFVTIFPSSLDLIKNQLQESPNVSITLTLHWCCNKLVQIKNLLVNIFVYIN